LREQLETTLQLRPDTADAIIARLQERAPAEEQPFRAFFFKTLQELDPAAVPRELFEPGIQQTLQQLIELRQQRNSIGQQLEQLGAVEISNTEVIQARTRLNRSKTIDELRAAAEQLSPEISKAIEQAEAGGASFEAIKQALLKQLRLNRRNGQ